MTRKLKVFGLVLVAICSMSAMIASAAQAVPQFTAGTYPATVTGSGGEKAGEKFTLGAADDNVSVECNTSEYHGVLAEASSTLEVTPHYTNCKAFGFLNATVTVEGCKYVFHATEKSGTSYKAHVDVVCPAGKSIKISAGTCTTEVKGQTGLTTAKGTNSGTNVLVKPEVSGVAYTVTADGFGCPLTGTGNKTGATYTSSGEITTTSGSGLSISGE